MKKVSLTEFARIIQADETLRARLAECADRDRATELLCRLAEEQGYELYADQPAGKQAVSDDDLSEVAGGRNVLTGPNSGVLYPYSWFVTILRLLVKEDEKQPPENPTAPETYHPTTTKL